MGLQKRSKTLSTLSIKLMSEGESERVDFKRSPDGVSADDLVAFANSEGGGHILVGIDEIVSEGAQIGTVRGCDVGDQTVLQILNKAVSCIPPVSVDIFIENLDDRPILRLQIDTSPTRPHCTPKRIYCRRDGSRTRPLHPNELLKIFLENEARAFAERFEAAAERITSDLTNLEDTLDRSIKNMADQLGWTDYQLSDTESLLHTIASSVNGLRSETSDIATRVRSLFRQDKREDPIRQREYKKLVADLAKEIDQNADMMRQIAGGTDPSIKVTVKGTPALELTRADLQQAFQEAAHQIREREDLKKYKTYRKVPRKATKSDLAGFLLLAKGEGAGSDLKSQIDGAIGLGFVKYDGQVVGTAALVDGNHRLRDRLFVDAKSKLRPEDHSQELKWINLLPHHRQKGQLTAMLAKLLPLAKGTAMFAVAENSNELLREVLPQHGFRAVGVSFNAPEIAKGACHLFARMGENAK